VRDCRRVDALLSRRLQPEQVINRARLSRVDVPFSRRLQDIKDFRERANNFQAVSTFLQQGYLLIKIS
jgi:hypothetical protein